MQSTAQPLRGPGGDYLERSNFMKQTTNYKLSQWEKSDRIQMEDFNGDNAKLEAALKAQAGTLAAHGASLDGMKTHAATLSAHESTLAAHTASLNAMKTHAATLSAHETAIAALNAAVSKRGNCQIQLVTYRGSNGGIASKPKTLTFAHRPMAIFLYGSPDNHFTWAARGYAQSYLTGNKAIISFSWGVRSVTWYGDNSTIGLDSSTCTYTAVALLEIQ